eukprot:scaffold99957_cov66-Phaeocystis_antarctica.AAC.4
MGSLLLIVLTLLRAPPAEAAASISATASAVRHPVGAARIAPPSVVAAGRPRSNIAKIMLRAATMGPPPPPVAADRANAGAAVLDTRLTLKSSRRNWLAAPTAACMRD